MFPPSTLTTARILEVFDEEISELGGRITDTFHDGKRVFTRSVLAHVAEVRPGDRVKGGVALKATDESIWLSPYIFREVCRNGAIIAETLTSYSLGDLHEQDTEIAIQFVRECTVACCTPEGFLENVRKMHTACQRQVDLNLSLLPLVSRLSASTGTGVITRILDHFFSEGDKSLFGLANAVTAVARDTPDPEVRWNLEEFGGGCAVGTAARHPDGGGPASIAQSRKAVEVG